MEKDGAYVHLRDISCRHSSGTLGPRSAKATKQTPEGFYSITQRQLPPLGALHRFRDLDCPNAFDRAHNHGGYSSHARRCFSVRCSP